ncbi:MAG TPA: YpdA family putative bacillithiol disulfide reductase [Terriglobales bacterium]|nr:YpdA family putative bacillithiol disulfide reductase [Terriglobales bacterium]
MQDTEKVTEPKPEQLSAHSIRWDLIIVGAGPSGLATAIEARKRKLAVLNIDKGCVVNSLFNYPTNMTFFTTPELLEIGEVPFSTQNNQKPTRSEALEYYRKVTAHYQLQVRQYETVTKLSGKDGHFAVSTTDLHGFAQTYHTRKMVLATGYYDLPNYLGCPGEDLPKVMHYYKEPHPYYDSDVVVIGAKNSAAIAALELYRHGARVTLVHRGSGIHSHVKYWVKPDIENRLKSGEIKSYFGSTVKEILPEAVVLKTPDGEVTLANDFVFALVGYHPDYDLLRRFGLELTKDQCRPVCDPETLESNVPGIYVAGVIVAGSRTNEIFIENGRFHGKLIAEHVSKQLRRG